MNFLPKDIENIILKYKNSIEIFYNHKKKFIKCINYIKNIDYEILNKNLSYRINKKEKYSIYYLSDNDMVFHWKSYMNY